MIKIKFTIFLTEKTTVVLDSFVLGQLEIRNLLSRNLAITMSDIETHVMVNDHESGKYIGNRYQVRKPGQGMVSGHWAPDIEY